MAKIEAFAFDSDAAATFLGWLDQIHLVTIHRAGGDTPVKGRNFGENADAAIAWAMEENREHRNVYWTVNRVPQGMHGKPSKRDIEGARYVHIDIDPPRDGSKFDTESVLETLEGLRHPPTFVIFSGAGLQPLWQLDGDSGNLDAIEHINLQAREMFSADACQNIDRLFRLPGSVNWPSAAKAGRGRVPSMASIMVPHTGEVYEPAQLAAMFPTAERLAAVKRERANVAGAEVLELEQFGWAQFSQIRLALERPKGPDRSKDCFVAACECVREGLSDIEIAGLLLNPALPISGHFLDQSNPQRAVERCIGAARAGNPDWQVVPQETRDAVANMANTMAAKAVKAGDNGQSVADAVVTNPATESKIDLGSVTIPEGVPAWLRDMSDPMRAMYSNIIEYAPSPRAELALGAAIVTFATAAGRRYETQSGLMSNVYCVGLSASGQGKDLPVNAPSQALMMAGAVDCVGGNVASAAGIMAAVEANPSLYLPIDEMGKLVAAMQDPRGNLKDAISVLLKLYSQAQSTFKGAMYANSKERPTTLIHRPCLSFYGVSTPSTFWAKINMANVEEGLLPRFILFNDQEPLSPPPRELRRMILADDLIERVKAVRAGAEGHITFPLGDGASVSPKPYRLPFADKAADDREYEIRHAQYLMLEATAEPMRPFVNRIAENAFKLALVRAVSADPANPVYSVADMDWGWQISERSVKEFMRAAEGNISENDYHANVKRIKAIIDGASANGGVSTSEIGRRCQQIKGRDRQDILDDLIEQGLATRTREASKAGRGREIYLGA